MVDELNNKFNHEESKSEKADDKEIDYKKNKIQNDTLATTAEKAV
jgi:hypothetical protein